MSAERFLTEPHYFRQAFQNSMVRIKNTPVIIGNTDGFGAELYYPLNSKSSYIKDIRNIELNIEPVELGFLNYRDKVTYLRRSPQRRWKQGLSIGSVVSPVNKTVFYSKSFSNIVVNRYPSLEECDKLLKENKKISCAFHRKWALKKGVQCPSLLYRGRVVGTYYEGKFYLTDNFKYLEESLEEVLND